MWSSMVIIGSIVKRINNHVQFPVVKFSTTGHYVAVIARVLTTTFVLLTTILFIINIITPTLQEVLTTTF
jgi:hypothetical protein